MSHNIWRRWVSFLFKKNRRPRARKQARAKGSNLGMEVLETRVVPATDTWTGLGHTLDWATAANWSTSGATQNRAPISGDTVVFPNLYTTPTTIVNNLTTNPVLSSINISGPNYKLNGQSSGPLSLSGGITISPNVATVTIAQTLDFLPPPATPQVTITVNNGSTLDLSSTVSNGDIVAASTVTVNKAGTGTLDLLSNSPNWNGNLTLATVGGTTGGIVQVSNTNALGNTAVTVSTNAQLQLLATAATGPFTISNTLVTNGSGSNGNGALWNATGNNSWWGSIQMDSDTTFSASSGTTLTLGIENNPTHTAISDNGSGHNLSIGGLINQGTGTVILPNANTYRGDTTVNNGILEIENPLSLGAGANALDSAQSGSPESETIVNYNPNSNIVGTLELNFNTFDLASNDPNALTGAPFQYYENAALTPNSVTKPTTTVGGFQVFNDILVLNGPGFNNQGALYNASGDNEWDGSIILGSPPPALANPWINNAPNTQLIVSGVISDQNQASSLTKIGTGELILNNANTYRNGTNITAGLVDIADSQALGVKTSAVSVSYGAGLQLDVDQGFDGTATRTHNRNLGYDSVNGTGVGQELDITVSGANGTFTLSLAGHTATVSVTSTTLSTDIQTAINTLLTDDGFTTESVSSVVQDGNVFRAIFTGPVTKIPSITVSGTTGTATATLNPIAGPAQELDITGTNGSFSLGLSGQTVTVANIASSALTTQIQTAVDSLLTSAGYTGESVAYVTQDGNLYRVVFTGPDVDIPLMAVTATTGNAVVPPTIPVYGLNVYNPLTAQGPGIATSPADSGALESHTGINTYSGTIALVDTAQLETITVSPSATSFTLTYKGFTSASLSATSPTLAADIQTALNALLVNAGEAGGVATVVESETDIFTVTLGGTLLGQPGPQLTVAALPTGTVTALVAQRATAIGVDVDNRVGHTLADNNYLQWDYSLTVQGAINGGDSIMNGPGLFGVGGGDLIKSGLGNLILPNDNTYGDAYDNTGSFIDVPGGITWANGFVTVSTETPDYFSVGDTIQITDMTPAGYNGTFTVSSIISATEFTFKLPVDPGAATYLLPTPAGPAPYVRLLPGVMDPTTDIQEGWITIDNNQSLGADFSPLGQNFSPAQRSPDTDQLDINAPVYFLQTLEPYIEIDAGGALHLDPLPSEPALNLYNNFLLSGNGLTSQNYGLIQQAGTIENLNGDNTLPGIIQLNGNAGIGVEQVPATGSQVPGGTSTNPPNTGFPGSTAPALTSSQLTLTGYLENYVNPFTNTTTVGGITKLGSRRLIIEGSGDYTGNVNVNYGVLLDQNDTGLGAFASTATVSIADGAALELGNTVNVEDVGGGTNPPNSASESTSAETGGLQSGVAENGGVQEGVQVWDETLNLKGNGDTTYSDSALTVLAGNATTTGPTVYTVTVTGSTTGDYFLSFNGVSTGPIAATATAAQVQAALTSILATGQSVVVTQDGNVYLVTFGGALINTTVPLLVNNSFATTSGVATLPVITSGTYSLTFNGQTTTQLSANATAAQVQTALANILGSGQSVAVTENSGDTSYTVTFGGSLSTTSLPIQVYTGTTPLVELTQIGTTTSELAPVNDPIVTSDAAWRGPVILGDNTTITVDTNFTLPANQTASRLVLAGTVSQGASPTPSNLTILGGGEVDLDGSNTPYTGTTYVQQGVVSIGNQAGLGTIITPEIQRLTLTGITANTSFTLDFPGYGYASSGLPLPGVPTTTDLTASIKYTGVVATDEINIENALDAALTTSSTGEADAGGSATVVETITAGTPTLTITFGGSLSGFPLGLLSAAIQSATPTAATAIELQQGAGGTLVENGSSLEIAGSFTVGGESLILEGNGTTQDVQSITLTGLSTGSFRLGFVGADTAGGAAVTDYTGQIPVSSNLATMAQAVQNALDGLGNIGGIGGNTNVTAQMSGGNIFFSVTFGGTLSGQNLQGETIVDGSQLVGGSISQGANTAGTQTITNVPTQWFETGPFATTNGQNTGKQTVSGQITSEAVDQNDPNVIYVGTAGGGVWKTIDGGKSWHPVFDAIPEVQILQMSEGATGSFKLSFTGPNSSGAIVTETTGSINPASSTLTYDIQSALDALTNIGGVGGQVTVTQYGDAAQLTNYYMVTFNGTQAGQSLNQMTVTTSSLFGTASMIEFQAGAGESTTSSTASDQAIYVGAVTINPDNSQIIYVGTGVLTNNNGNAGGYAGTGVYQSLDGGLTWSLMLDSTSETGAANITNPVTGTNLVNPFFGMGISSIAVEPALLPDQVLETWDITAASWSVVAGVGTVTITAPGNTLGVNETVGIQGMTPSAYNGNFTVTSVNTLNDTFTYTLNNNPGIATVLGTASNSHAAQDDTIFVADGVVASTYPGFLSATTSYPYAEYGFGNGVPNGGLVSAAYPNGDALVGQLAPPGGDALPDEPTLPNATGNILSNGTLGGTGQLAGIWRFVPGDVSNLGTWFDTTDVTNNGRDTIDGPTGTPPFNPGPNDDFRVGFPEEGDVRWTDVKLIPNTIETRSTPTSPYFYYNEWQVYGALGSPGTNYDEAGPPTTDGGVNGANAVYFGDGSGNWWLGTEQIPQDEVQTITLADPSDTDGKFALAFNGVWTGEDLGGAFNNVPIPTYDPNNPNTGGYASEIANALNHLSTIANLTVPGFVVVQSTSNAGSIEVYTVTFEGGLSDSPQPQLEAYPPGNGPGGGPVGEPPPSGGLQPYSAGNTGVFISITTPGGGFDNEPPTEFPTWIAYEDSLRAIGPGLTATPLPPDNGYITLSGGYTYEPLTPLPGGATGSAGDDLFAGFSDTVYASVANSNNGDLEAIIKTEFSASYTEFWNTQGTGFNWTTVLDPTFGAAIDDMNGQGDYANAIVVDPNNLNIVYIGGSSAAEADGSYANPTSMIYESTDGGTTWTDVTGGRPGSSSNDTPSNAVHALAFDGGNILAGTDGGIWSLNQDTNNWVDLNSDLAIAQVNSASAGPSNSNEIVVGTENNGLDYFSGLSSWIESDQNGTPIGSGPSGGEVYVVDSNGVATIYAVLSNQFGGGQNPTTYGTPDTANGSSIFVESVDGGKTWTQITTLPFPANPNLPADSLDTTGSPFFSFYINPLDTSEILVASQDGLFLSTDAANSWQTLSFPGFDPTVVALPSYQGVFADDSSFPDVKNIGSQVPDTSTIYVAAYFEGPLGLEQGLFVTKDLGLNWQLRTPAAINATAEPGPIESITVNPANRDNVFVVTQGSPNSGQNQIWESTDAGQNWSLIGGASSSFAGLPDVPFWQLAVDPRNGNLFIGTDDGVYELPNAVPITPEGSAAVPTQPEYTDSWIKFGTGLPDVSVHTLTLNLSTNTLLAGTDGRGVYQLYLDAAETATDAVFINGVQTTVLPASGALMALSGTSAWGGPVVLVGDSASNTVTLGSDGTQGLPDGVTAATLNILGQISDVNPGTNTTLTKTGNGDVIFSDSNVYGGSTVVGQGNLIADNYTALGLPTYGVIGGTNLTVTGTNAVTPDGYTPVAAEVGDKLEISGGAGWTPGFYLITGVSNGQWTLGSSPALTGTALGQWKLITTPSLASGTDLTESSTIDTAVTPDGYTPINSNIGGELEITGGTGWTPGIYQIVGVSNGQWILNSSAAALNASGGQWTFFPPTNGTTVVAGAALGLLTNLAPYQVTLNGNGFSFDEHYLGALVDFSGADTTFSGELIVNPSVADAVTPSVTIGVDSGGTLTLTGTISGGAGGFTLVKESTGTLVLDDSNDFVGTTVVYQGAIAVENSNAFGFTEDPANLVEVIDGAQVQMQDPGEVLTLTDTASTGTFDLSYNGDTTTTPLNLASTTLASDIQTELNALANIQGVGGSVTVTEAPYETLTIPTGAAGTFTLSFTGENALGATVTDTTGLLNLANLTALDIENALNALANIGGASSGVSVVQTAPGIFAIQFTGDLSDTFVPLLVANNSNVANGPISVANTFSIAFGGSLVGQDLDNTIAVTNPTNLAGGTKQISVANTQTGSTISVGNPLKLSGTGITQSGPIENSGALVGTGGFSTWAGPITLTTLPGFEPTTPAAGTVAIGALQYATLSTTGGIGNATTTGLLKVGLGQVDLASANTYLGATEVAQGILDVQNNNALGARTTSGGLGIVDDVYTDGSFLLSMDGHTVSVAANASSATMAAKVKTLVTDSGLFVSGGTVNVHQTKLNSTYDAPIADPLPNGNLYTITFGGTMAETPLPSFTAIGTDDAITAFASVVAPLGVDAIVDNNTNGVGELELDNTQLATAPATGLDVTAYTLTLNGFGPNGSAPSAGTAPTGNGALYNFAGNNTWTGPVILTTNSSVGVAPQSSTNPDSSLSLTDVQSVQTVNTQGNAESTEPVLDKVDTGTLIFPDVSGTTFEATTYYSTGSQTNLGTVYIYTGDVQVDSALTLTNNPSNTGTGVGQILLAGGTLSGTGEVESITDASTSDSVAGGTINPGDNLNGQVSGTLSSIATSPPYATDVSLNPDDTYYVNLGLPTTGIPPQAGSNTDVLHVNGTISLNGATLNGLVAAGIVQGDSYTIITANTIEGQFGSPVASVSPTETGATSATIAYIDGEKFEVDYFESTPGSERVDIIRELINVTSDLTVATSSPVYGQDVQFVYTVATAPPDVGVGVPQPTGTAVFHVTDPTQQASNTYTTYDVQIINGVATLDVAAETGQPLIEGLEDTPSEGYTVTASFDGYDAAGNDTYNQTSAALSPNPLIVAPANVSTSLSLTYAGYPSPQVYGQPYTLTATVATTVGTSALPGSTVETGTLAPAGTVTFFDSYDGGTAQAIATVPLTTPPAGTTTATATLTSSTLAGFLDAGNNSVYAVYDYEDYLNNVAPSPYNYYPYPAAGSQSLNVGLSIHQATTTTTVTVTAPSSATAPITAASWSSVAGVGTATLTAPGNSLVVGQSVVIQGMSPAAYNGTFTVTAVNTAAQSFTYSLANNPGVATVLGTASSLAYGEAGETITATVAPEFGGNPTGDVTIYDGSTVLATEPVSTVGNVTSFTYTTMPGQLQVGDPGTITAVYVGDTNFYGSTGTTSQITFGSSTTTSPLVVNKATTTVGLSSSAPAGATYGQQVTYTATVAPEYGGSPGGQVSFYEGGTNFLGYGTLVNVNGVMTATYTTTTTQLPVGNPTLPATQSITAVYTGDNNFIGNTSAPFGQLITPATSTTSVVASPTTSVYGQPVTVTATVHSSVPNGSIPTGTVTFYSNGVPLGTGTLETTGGVTTATYTTTLVNKLSQLPLGTDSITATYGGNSFYSPSSASPTTETVSADSTTTLVSSSGPILPGQSVTITAEVIPNSPGSGFPVGNVAFTLNGFALTGSPVTLTTAPNGLTYAQITIASNNPNLVIGTNAVAAVFNPAPSSDDVAPQTDFTTSTGQYSQVEEDATTLTVKTSLTPSVYGQSVTLTATIQPAQTTSAIPTGTVTFTDGATVLGTATVGSVNGGLATAVLTLTDLPVGTNQTITAYYSGDTIFLSKAASVTQTVNQDTTITTLSASATSVEKGQTVIFTAQVLPVSPGAGIPTGTVTFKEGATVLGTGTLNSGVATLQTTLKVVGTDTITATYSGSADDKTSSGSIKVKVAAVGTRASIVTVSSSQNPSIFGQSVTFTAIVQDAGKAPVHTPTGTVSFFTGTTLLGYGTLSTSGGITAATFSTTALPVGSDSITAVYNGNATFGSATSQLLAQTVYSVPTRASEITLADSSTLVSNANNIQTYTSTFGQPVTFTATVTDEGTGTTQTPTGTVTFYATNTVTNAVITLGTGTLSGTNGISTASLTYDSLQAVPNNTYVISATYNGDGAFASESNVTNTVKQVVTQGTTEVLLTPSANPAYYGQSVTFTAQVIVPNSTAVPLGSVEFFVGSQQIGGSGASYALNSNGEVSLTLPVTAANNFVVGSSGNLVTVVYTGNPGESTTSTYQINEIVNPAPTTITLSFPATSQAAITFTATVTGTYGGVPQGTVNFFVNGVQVGSGTVNSSGVATFTDTAGVSTGKHTIEAVFVNLDEDYLDSQVIVISTFTVGRGTGG